MIAEIEEFIKIQNSIDKILKESPFKMSYIIEKSGIKKPTFFRKLKEKKFTAEELLAIARLVDQTRWRNETKEEILESLKRGEEDIKAGRYYTQDEWLQMREERLKKYRDEYGIDHNS